ncbi:MAG: helix-turn-helix transcriptional regulator, partial [Clostridium sp.]|nr:helix-turn-helix transcriptional regulator [Clostridium sp.]
YLSRKLKAGLNTTFVDLLNQYRIKKALNMLNQGTMRIYEISDELGFSEYKHFCSVFKKYTNVTPSEFLKNGGVAVVGEKETHG